MLRGLNLAVEPGQVVALVGPSGGGKSSIVKLVERFYLPQSGAVLLDGRDVGVYNSKWLRRQVALVRNVFACRVAGRERSGGALCAALLRQCRAAARRVALACPASAQRRACLPCCSLGLPPRDALGSWPQVSQEPVLYGRSIRWVFACCFRSGPSHGHV